MDFKVIQGDAAYLPIQDESVDLTVTSPPYDNLRKYNGYKFDFERVAKELFRVTKHGGVVVWVVGDATIGGSETGTSFRQALYFKDIGFNLHDTMIYLKKNPMPLKHNRYAPCFEFMFVLSRGVPVTVNLLKERTLATGVEKYTGTQQENGRFTAYGQTRNLERIKLNVWEFNVGFSQTTADGYAYNHPAIFPEQLAYDHIISWSNEGDTILDPMCGSGTTLKMAVIAKRNAIGVDISREYCELSRVRAIRASGMPCDIPKRIQSDRDLPLFHSALDEDAA